MLGPGDVLKISVYGNPDLTTEARVSDAGAITFPLLGPVAIGGMTAAEAEKKVAGQLVSGGFLKKAEVTILITQIQNQQISILGQVLRPGRYPIEGKRSIFDMLSLAGGIAPDGGDTISLIRKRNRETTKEIIDVLG